MLASHAHTALFQTINLTQGTWTKYFLDAVNDASITAKHSGFSSSQYAAVHHNVMNTSADVGSVWYATIEGGSEWGRQASASGLEATIAASKYGDKTVWRSIPCHSFLWSLEKQK
ncbi:hypothetical protein V8E55_011623 [Tylopilus felleus]